MASLHGYGEAMDWACDLVADLDAWRRGEIPFSALQRTAVLASEPGMGKTTFVRSLAKAAGLPSLQKVDTTRDQAPAISTISCCHWQQFAHQAGHGDKGRTFAFLSMDAGEAKRAVVAKLEAMGVPFVDVGMGLELVDGSLGGLLRVTTSTPAKRDHVHNGRISFHDAPNDAVYATNIQVADLNMLNAALAVIKWKKIRGFYRDAEREHHSTFTTDSNMLLNGDLE